MCVCVFVYMYVCMCVYIDIRTHTPKVYHRVVVGGGHCECNCLLRCLWHNNTRQLCPTAVHLDCLYIWNNSLCGRHSQVQPSAGDNGLHGPRYHDLCKCVCFCARFIVGRFGRSHCWFSSCANFIMSADIRMEI